jgi:hypothetical protein
MDTDLRIPVTSEQKQLILEATSEEPEGMAAWARAVLLHAARDRPARPPADVEREFRELADQWRAETKYLSNVTKKSIHPAYQRIIGMGEAVVPLILEELAQRPGDWFWALTAITRANPITEAVAGDVDAMTEAWQQWGRAAGYLNDSPTRTKPSSPTSERAGT